MLEFGGTAYAHLALEMLADRNERPRWEQAPRTTKAVASLIRSQNSVLSIMAEPDFNSYFKTTMPIPWNCAP